MTSVTPEPKRDDELPAIMDLIGSASAALEPVVFVEPPTNTDKLDSVQAPVKPKVPDEPPATADEPDPIPSCVETSGQDEQNVDNPTISILPPPEPATAGRVKQAVAPSIEQHSQQPGPSFGHWSSTLFEIKQKIEPLASGTLQRLPRLDQVCLVAGSRSTYLPFPTASQRESVDLVTQRRVALRLLMYCASLPTAEFASPNGFLGPPTSVPYYPTGDLEADRNVAFTTALDCLDDLIVILTGGAKAEIAGALSELAQALSDLGLHNYASNVSGFALEIYRELYSAEPDQFRSRIASVQSLRANILVDLGRNDDAAGAAEEAVTILKEKEDTQPELVYAMLNYAVLLGAIGRGDGTAAVAFELMALIDDPTVLQPDIILISPLCQLCVSTACIELDSELALSEADKAIEASRASLDANSKVVLAGALLVKSKIFSSNGQNDIACSISTEAVTLFRSASVDRHVFSLLLGHALFTNSHHLSEVNRKGDSYTTINEAVETWQAVQISAPVASKRPLAWALFELAKYRHKGADKQKLRTELQIAETAVSTFREVSPLDYAGLADALFLYADRMLELDKNRYAATYAEESVQYFREAREESPHKYALDLIFSLSLASSCLACTERSADALEYAKQAVEVQHERKSDGDPKYGNHLRKLLMDVIFRSTEMGMQQDAMPWMQELQQLGDPEDGECSVCVAGDRD
jgi:tetratricopeptide (TPR) repeat protein